MILKIFEAKDDWKAYIFSELLEGHELGKLQWSMSKLDINRQSI